MKYHYQRGLYRECSTRKFICCLLLLDGIVLSLFFAASIYHTYMVNHDLQVVNDWCSKAICIDTNTGTNSTSPQPHKNIIVHKI